MKKRNLIIDTDPGIDDAAAITILLSEPSLDVKLIASVSGMLESSIQPIMH